MGAVKQNPHTIVSRITYKPGWILKLDMALGYKHFLYWTFTAPDVTLPGTPATSWNSRKWYLSKHMTENEIVQTALAAVLMAEEHEAREAFAYKGVNLFHPHIEIAALMRASKRKDVRK